MGLSETFVCRKVKKLRKLVLRYAKNELFRNIFYFYRFLEKCAIIVSQKNKEYNLCDETLFAKYLFC